MAASALPATLRGVTSTKIAELKKQRKDFQDAKATIEANVSKCRKAGDRIGETKALIDGACRLESVYLKDLESEDAQDLTLHPPDDGSADSKLYTYSRLLKQSVIDPALPKSVIDDIQRDLVKDLDLKTIQHQHAEFYTQLVTEYVSADDGADTSQFESVGREEMHEQRKTWEEIVFVTTEVDQDNIESYLTNLFTSRSQVKRAHEGLRQRLRAFSVNLASQEIFDMDSLKTYIKGLMATDLLNEEKKAILKTFTSNKAVLQEVADVLTMRFKTLDTWQYSTENGAILVEQRRQLNGKYRFYLDEDVLDAIMIHAVGMKWAVEVRDSLKQFQSSHAWSRPQTEIPLKDRQRRQWFMGSRSAAESVATRRASDYTRDYFMTLLPDTAEDGPRSYDDSDSDDDDPQAAFTRKNPLETKHGLLHLLVTEAIIARHVNPQVEHTVIRSDFKWFGPSLPHASIFKTLEFFGVEDPWLSFFRKFLATPLRFAQDGPDGQIRVRQRGIPMSMVLADVMGEVVLFVMDFAVNSSTKGFLYRLHDDFWYWNDKESCRLAWQQMRHFANVMGMSFNEEKTGSVVFPPAAEESETSDDESTDSGPVVVSGLPRGDVRWGFLKLDTKLCRFVIDQKEVDKHIQELKVQLKAHSSSVFDYIQAYNSYAARFFTNNFGKPSFGFGRVHVDDMITTLNRVHNELYSQGRVADELAFMVEKRFGVKASDIPDGFWFFPVAAFGGMEIHSPLVSLVNMRESFRRTPEKILEKTMESEDAEYIDAKLRYEQANHGWGMASGNSSLKTALNMSGDEPFWSKQEYLQYREERSPSLLSAYGELLQVPEEQPISLTPQINSWLATLENGKKTAIGEWSDMTPYWKSIVASYGKDIFDKFGSLKMVDATQVPLGVIHVMKSSKVAWQG